VNRATGKKLVRFGLVAPVGARIGDRIQVADRNVDPEPVILAARLEQKDGDFRIGGQPVGEQAACAAGADDDVVERSERVCHRNLPR
jgi:hypothetical protein